MNVSFELLSEAARAEARELEAVCREGIVNLPVRRSQTENAIT